MKAVEIITNPEVDKIFESYPKEVKKQMKALRKLVHDTAQKTNHITKVEETLKWGEPSFVTKQGSTLRMDWKAKTPDQYAMYFQCSSRLVETFKLVFGDAFTYEGKRAIVFKLDQDIPTEALAACIKATLSYHKVKHLMMLGI